MKSFIFITIMIFSGKIFAYSDFRVDQETLEHKNAEQLKKYKANPDTCFISETTKQVCTKAYARKSCDGGPYCSGSQPDFDSICNTDEVEGDSDCYCVDTGSVVNGYRVGVLNSKNEYVKEKSFWWEWTARRYLEDLLDKGLCK